MAEDNGRMINEFTEGWNHLNRRCTTIRTTERMGMLEGVTDDQVRRASVLAMGESHSCTWLNAIPCPIIGTHLTDKDFTIGIWSRHG